MSNSSSFAAALRDLARQASSTAPTEPMSQKATGLLPKHYIPPYSALHSNGTSGNEDCGLSVVQLPHHQRMGLLPAAVDDPLLVQSIAHSDALRYLSTIHSMSAGLTSAQQLIAAKDMNKWVELQRALPRQNNVHRSDWLADNNMLLLPYQQMMSSYMTPPTLLTHANFTYPALLLEQAQLAQRIALFQQQMSVNRPSDRSYVNRVMHCTEGPAKRDPQVEPPCTLPHSSGDVLTPIAPVGFKRYLTSSTPQEQSLSEQLRVKSPANKSSNGIKLYRPFEDCPSPVNCSVSSSNCVDSQLLTKRSPVVCHVRSKIDTNIKALRRRRSLCGVASDGDSSSSSDDSDSARRRLYVIKHVKHCPAELTREKFCFLHDLNLTTKSQSQDIIYKMAMKRKYHFREYDDLETENTSSEGLSSPPPPPPPREDEPRQSALQFMIGLSLQRLTPARREACAGVRNICNQERLARLSRPKRPKANGTQSESCSLSEPPTSTAIGGVVKNSSSPTVQSVGVKQSPTSAVPASAVSKLASHSTESLLLDASLAKQFEPNIETSTTVIIEPLVTVKSEQNQQQKAWNFAQQFHNSVFEETFKRAVDVRIPSMRTRSNNGLTHGKHTMNTYSAPQWPGMEILMHAYQQRNDSSERYTV